MFHINNITFTYKKTPVLQNISFDIHAGDWLGLLGPNGSGKTTLIKCLSGNLKPQSGDISLSPSPIRGESGGEGVFKLLSSFSAKELARIIAVVPQDSSILFPFTALEVVLMGRSPFTKNFGFETKSDIETAKKSMIVTDTLEFKDRQFNELSGGERQRVIIARALAQEPKILIMDEPTSFLDIKHQKDILELIKKLNEENGLTVVSAMHDINSALFYCKSLMFIKNGRIHKIGPTNKVVTYTNLKEVFETEVYVGINDLNGRPYYLPYSV